MLTETQCKWLTKYLTPELLALLKQAQKWLPQEWSMGDRYYDVIDKEVRVYDSLDDVALFDGRCWHYPYPHQIWKMIDWNVWKIYVFKNGEVEISHRNLSREIRIRDTDPEPALLKAFIWQKEREEKEK